MLSEETTVQIERDLLKILDELKSKKGWTDAQWGDEAFRDEKNGRRKVQNLKHGLVRLRVGDFVKLSHALDAPTARIFDNALDRNGL